MPDEITRQALARDKAIAQTVAEMERFLKSKLQKLIVYYTNGVDSAEESIYNFGRLYEDLKAAGLTKEIAKLDELYANELRSVQKVMAGVDRSMLLTDTDLDVAETLISYDTSALESRMRSSVTSLRSAIVNGITGQNEVNFNDVVDRYGETIARQLETELRTNLSGFNQAIVNKKAADAGFEYFIYLGPDDLVTRPFCQCVIAGGTFQGQAFRGGRVYSKKEILKMDNGQMLTVMEYGGGYNCRHQWRPISTEEAEAIIGKQKDGA